MKKGVADILDNLLARHTELAGCRNDLEKAFDLLKQCYENGGKVLICGNGGSAADSEHIVGELMKGFLLKRKVGNEIWDKLREAFPSEGEYLADHLQGALPAISLVSQSAIASAYINDIAADLVFAQQVFGYAKVGDVLIGLSTSGNSPNVLNALKVAKITGMRSIGLTGSAGGAMAGLCDVTICVPAAETYKIQEYHLPVYHAICAMLEMEFFG